jgi:hypothetical protein
MTDADRIKVKMESALEGLEAELHRAIEDRITPGMNTVEIRAATDTEIMMALEALDQIRAAMLAELDAVAVDLPDADGEPGEIVS